MGTWTLFLSNLSIVPASPTQASLIANDSRFVIIGQIAAMFVLFVRSSPSTRGDDTIHHAACPAPTLTVSRN